MHNHDAGHYSGFRSGFVGSVGGAFAFRPASQTEIRADSGSAADGINVGRSGYRFPGSNFLASSGWGNGKNLLIFAGHGSVAIDSHSPN